MVRKIRFISEEFLIHKSDKVIAYSPGLKKWLISHVKLAEDKIIVIPPHVDTNFFTPGLNGRMIREKYGLNNSKVIMYVGIINYTRGIDALIEALGILKQTNKDVKLMIVGPIRRNAIPYQNNLEKNVRDLGLDEDVIFTDYIPFTQVPEFISAADIMVVPHRYTFTYEISPPVKILEYMASQKPIVTTNVGIKDYIQHHDNGIIVNPDQPSALADGILYLLNNPSIAEKLATNARNFVQQNLRKEMMIEKFEESLLSIMR
jgi:glycosyltransferase involved in cell wall biosynthesis